LKVLLHKLFLVPALKKGLKNCLVFGNDGTLIIKLPIYTEIIEQMQDFWMWLYSLIKQSFVETLDNKPKQS